MIEMKQDRTKSSNVPNLRFPEFGGEWKECKLGDVTSYANEKVKTKSRIRK